MELIYGFLEKTRIPRFIKVIEVFCFVYNIYMEVSVKNTLWMAALCKRHDTEQQQDTEEKEKEK